MYLYYLKKNVMISSSCILENGILFFLKESLCFYSSESMQKINPCIHDQRLTIIEKCELLGTQKTVSLHFEEE